jgi:hypothetical protein
MATYLRQIIIILNNILAKKNYVSKAAHQKLNTLVNSLELSSANTFPK